MSGQEKVDSLDEIDQIMNEIEKLQTDMKSANDVMAEFQPSDGDASMEEALSTLKDDESSTPNLIEQSLEADLDAELGSDESLDDVLERAEAEIEEELVEDLTVSEIRKSSVSVTLSGDMTLNLSYEFEGQEVTIGFVDGALHVELSDGTEFKLPLRRSGLKRVA
jgi:predicted  nucleic acid-binding Zn-ribbon protein